MIAIKDTEGGDLQFERTPDGGLQVLIRFDMLQYGIMETQRTMLPAEAAAFAAAAAAVAARTSGCRRVHLEGAQVPKQPGVIADAQQYIDVSPWGPDLFGLSWSFVDPDGEPASGGATIHPSAMAELDAGLRKLFGRQPGAPS